ncbi:unnamed protein product, partial [marine sediment metagenome]
MYDLLQEKGAGHIKIYGGGGGVILPKELEELHNYGIARLFTPDDGRTMGLQGMINEVVKGADFPTGKNVNITGKDIKNRDYRLIARLISAAENYPKEVKDLLVSLNQDKNKTPVIG